VYDVDGRSASVAALNCVDEDAAAAAAVRAGSVRRGTDAGVRDGISVQLLNGDRRRAASSEMLRSEHGRCRASDELSDD